MVAALDTWKAQGQQSDTDETASAALLFGLLAAQGVGTAITQALTPLLGQVYLEGYGIGVRAATAQVTGESVDWADWKPGDPAEATDPALDPLTRGAAQTASDMADTRLATLARQLATAVRRGETADQITQLIHATLDDPDRAYRIAITEIVKAQSAATISTYQRHGVAEHIWADAEDAKVCPTCEANAKQGAVQVGMPFQSGDVGPPNHPGDRCALLAVIKPLGGSRG